MAASNYTKIERLRSYSSAFSRSVFTDIIKYDDFSRLNHLFSTYNASLKSARTYSDYIKYLYRSIKKEYRCEYVYKNELINQLLLKRYGTKTTIAINEFRVGGSIADFVLFNGESKAFEIKTEYDTDKRLEQQLDDYSKLFQKCFIVIPNELVSQYELSISANIGIIALSIENGRINLKEVRAAAADDTIDTCVLMRSLRTSEFKNIVSAYFGMLPDVSCFEMFDTCEKWMESIPYAVLNKLFLTEIKKRENSTHLLRSLPAEIRQICLSMNLTKKQIPSLLEKLNKPINL